MWWNSVISEEAFVIEKDLLHGSCYQIGNNQRVVTVETFVLAVLTCETSPYFMCQEVLIRS
jgi:hypothetical protein